MRITQYIRCILGRGHRFKPSARKPGKETCTHCRVRRKRRRP